MRPIVAALLIAYGLGARAADVVIVDPQGRPARRATVVCADPPACKRMRCEASGFLPGEYAVSEASPRCTLRPAAVIEIQLPAKVASSGLEAKLVSSKKDASEARVPIPKPAPDAIVAKLELPAVKPGRYALEISRARDGWSCRAELGVLGAGRTRLAPAWHEPASIGVRVKRPDGQPAVGIPVRGWGGRPGGRDPAGKQPSGAWTCAAPDTPVTDTHGAAVLSLDTSEELLIVAGDWAGPAGMAYATLDRVPAEAVVLTLALPTRLKAKLVDDKDRPVGCESSLTDLSPDVTWLTSALAGAALKALCDPQGGIVLGPYPSSPVTLQVRPRSGMPILLGVDPAAPGSIADLGVLRVKNGESIRVVVQDESGHPIPGASVEARGKSGVVLAVAGVTGEDGGVDLPGLPKRALIDLEVEAKGYLKADRSGLELDASPYTVKLAPGGAIEGRVRDTAGDPVVGARILGEGAGGRLERDVRSGDDGAYAIEGVPDGAWRVWAAADGYATSRPVSAIVEKPLRTDEVDLTMEPAAGLSGIVADATGSPIPGALVRLLDGWQKDDLERADARAEATADAAGSFTLRLAPPPNTWLVATKSGYAPAAMRTPMDKTGPGDLVLTLGVPAAALAHLPRGVRTTSDLTVVDGAGIGRRVPIGGRTQILLTDLAPGSGVVGIATGAGREVSLVAGQTVDVSLDAASAVEGRVTADGAPAARTRVEAVREADGGISMAAGDLTDERGRFRIEGLGAGPYRLVAVGEEGRGELGVELAEGETRRVDLVLRSVRLLLTVTDGADGKPVIGAVLNVRPPGATCNSISSTSTWGDPGEVGYELAVGAGGCLSARTDASGNARVTLAAPGSYDLATYEPSYEDWSSSAALGEGATAKKVSLTKRAAKPDQKAHVVVNLNTEPPGMLGQIWCISGGNTNSSSPVGTRHDCGEMPRGPATIRFHADGYGWGVKTVDVPETAELVVDLHVPRGGMLVVPVTSESAPGPRVVDANGTSWAGPRGEGFIAGRFEDVPNVGKGWVFRDLPPGTYIATIDGKARSAVPLASAGVAVAY